MKITDISIQARNKDRVNISVDGKYAFSLDVFQVGELGLKNGREVTPEEIVKWEEESAFGKLYARALEYTMMRPHSAREVRDYLWRNTQTKRVKINGGRRYAVSGKQSKADDDTHGRAYETVEKQGVSKEIADRVYTRLEEKGHINDENFARWWVETRHQTKGISMRKLTAELRAKGVATETIEQTMQNCTREEKSEIEKVIAKKRARYAGDEQKLVAYLARQGFSYDDIRGALADSSDMAGLH